jgi:hypothetical protein
MGPRGWSIVAWCGGVVAAMGALLLLAYGTGEEGVRAVVRHTAQTSFALFIATYSASSARALWRTPFTAWLLANRRYVGVGFAVSHAFHLLAIIALYRVSPSFRADLSWSTLIGGGLAFVLVFVMAATSSDRAVALLGRRAWKALHTAGIHYIWFIFFISYTPRMLITSIAYAPFVVLLLAGLGLRIAARLRLRQNRPAQAKAA